MGFEPTRGDPNGLAVHRLNHSATSSEGLFKIAHNNICFLPIIILPSSIKDKKAHNSTLEFLTPDLWPRGLMDKASDFGSEDCEFESRRGR